MRNRKMESNLNPSDFSELYKSRKKKEYLLQKFDKNKKPFIIIHPPPNANGSTSVHAIFVYEMLLFDFIK
jgi:valyl-tRNA synthetase